MKPRLPQSVLLSVVTLLSLAALPGFGRVTLPAGVTAQVGPSSNSADWPMYGHDWSRTNYNPAEKTINAGNVSQLVSRWQSPELGSNGTPPSGAPSVASGKVYVGSSRSSGDNFFAFDAATGAQAWTANVGYKSDCFNVGIGSTSAISGSTLVVGGGDAAYYGLNANTGARLWRSAMNVGSSGFAWTSPLIANGKAYVGMASRCDNPSVRGEVRALDLQSGSLSATQYFVPAGKAGGGIWNSPALSPDGGTLLVATGEDFAGYNGPYNRAIVSLDSRTLEIKQTHQQGSLNQDADFGTTPIVFSDNQKRILVGANHKDGVFYAYVLNNINGGPIWSRETGVTVGMMPAYDPSFGDGGTLFIQGGGDRLYAVDPATGKDRWPDVGVGGQDNMAVANGVIYINEEGALKVLDERNGSLLRTITPARSGASNSGVAISNGVVYWLSGNYLNAWSLPGGAAPTPAPTSAPPALPGTGSKLFPQTGKSVTGIFLDYWNNHGALPQQGYPISDLMQEKSDLDGKTYTVQYFERAVFEYHPENQPPYNVLLSQLGTVRYRQKYQGGAPAQQSEQGSILFPQTGKRVGGSFLQYWQQNGGVAQQGYPISEEFQERSDLDGKIYTVQYFERAVFEYHSENQPPYNVLLSLLGDFQLKSKYPGR